MPIRQLGAFLPGTGIGGAGVHWNGQTWRFHPRDFTIRTSTIDRYGASAIPPGMTIQDWGITYDELEPYMDKFDYMAGIAGKAGNLNGQDHPRRQRVRGAAVARVPGQASAGHRGWRAVPEGRRRSSATTRSSPRRRTCRAPYTNPDGISRGQLHLLRVLRAVRLRGRRQGRPDDDRAPRRAQDGEVQDHQLRERVRDRERRQDRPERPLLRQHGPGQGTAGGHHRDGRVRLQQREDCC